MTPIHFDRRLNILLGLSAVVLVGILAFATLAVPAILSTDSTTEALDDQSDLQGCRATYRAELVDERMAVLFIAKARLDEATNLGLEAVVRDDDETLQEAASRFLALREGVDRAALSLEQGIESYRNLVTQSTEHPDQFLVGCDA